MKRSSTRPAAVPETVDVAAAPAVAPTAGKRRTTAAKTPAADGAPRAAPVARTTKARKAVETPPAAVAAPLEDIGDGGPSELPRKEAAADPPQDAASREQRIRELAYARYLERGGRPGDATSDWLEAEALLPPPAA